MSSKTKPNDGPPSAGLEALHATRPTAEVLFAPLSKRRCHLAHDPGARDLVDQLKWLTCLARVERLIARWDHCDIPGIGEHLPHGIDRMTIDFQATARDTVELGSHRLSR